MSCDVLDETSRSSVDSAPVAESRKLAVWSTPFPGGPAPLPKLTLDARRSAPLPPAFAAQLDRLIAEHGQLGWPAPVCGVMAP